MERMAGGPPDAEQAIHFTAPPTAEGMDWAQQVPLPQGPPVGADGKLAMSETLLERAGPASPFGEDMTFPVPTDRLNYLHWQADAEPESRAHE